MITFHYIRWRNFLSTGNVFTEIKLDESPNTLIVGGNGSGKSSLLDALCFSLFGKPFRKINKPQLVNSVNGKDCVVEVEFTTNNKKYKVVRGIKPNIFEIWCDGVFLNQDSASKDYQEHLEKFILKMNYKSFTQIVILGSASFTPFMQLSAADRRTVIEDLLDIQVFSVMNQIVKQRWSENKDLIERNRINLGAIESKKQYLEKTIESLKKSNDDKVKQLEKQKKQYSKEIVEIEKQIEKTNAEIDALLDSVTNQDTIKSKHTKLLKLQTQIATKSERHKRDAEFFLDTEECPTCKQKIDEEFKENQIDHHNLEAARMDAGLKDISKEIDACVNEITSIQKILSEVADLKTTIASLKTKKASNEKSVKTLDDQIIASGSSDTLLLESVEELKSVEKTLKETIEEKESLHDERQYIDTALQLLKDGGIKTKIIKQYLPIINKLINTYLMKMGFFVNFNINENFEETIKSRYRDEFSYQNFSEGEKTRIDLAILLTWRAIAKMKNSAACNILILDEIFDGSLDVNGMDEFVKIMWSLVDDTNVFIISHKTDQMIDKFKRVIRFTKEKNFSRIAV